MTIAAADLHVHSRYSDRPSERLLARVGAPESYTDPRLVYRRCRERGMSLVTITDHDTIDGALEIAHLPGAFISCEVTVEFPEDGCPFHCLVFGIDQAQHREIQRLRGNVYELRDWLYDHRVAHAVAHPLYAVDRRLRPEHVEKLFVLFKCFEGLNGAHEARLSMVTRAVLDNLTPRQIDQLANRHAINPRDREPWRKHLIAGSDDHCGLYLASTWSSLEADGPVSPGRFVDALRRGQLAIQGAPGSSLKLGRGLHRIAARFARSRTRTDDGASRTIAWLGDSIARAAGAHGDRLETEPGSGTGVHSGFPEFVAAAIQSEIASAANDPGPAERTSFRLASRIASRLSIEGAARGMAALSRGELADALDALHALLPAAAAAAPYVVAWKVHHQDEPLVRAITDRFPAARLLRERSGRTAWFRDAPAADETVENTLGLAIELAGGAERLDVLHLPAGAIELPSIAGEAFQPLLDLGLLGSLGAPLELPPVLDLIDHCERRRFDAVLVTGVGPMAAAARCAAWCLELDLVAVVTVEAWRELESALGALLPEDALLAYLRWLYRPAREVRAIGPQARALLDRAGIAATVTAAAETRPICGSMPIERLPAALTSVS